MPRVTMTMVAREARVSVSTVSHVVNGTRPVNPDTRRQVLEAMERLGFQHRPVSGSLAAGSTLTIGLALSASVNPALRELVDGVEEEASRRGLQMILADTHDDPEHEERVVARTVSYTHLDVYKRQGFSLSVAGVRADRTRDPLLYSLRFVARIQGGP